MNEGTNRPKSPIFEVVDGSPKLLDKHAQFLRAGGEDLLHALNDVFRQELWPWDKEPHVQASYGAFCAGVAWTTKFLRTLNTLSQNRKAALDLIKAGDSTINEATKRVLMDTYGYTEEDLQ